MCEPTESHLENMDAEPITCQRIARVCQELLAQIEGVDQLTPEQLLEFEELTVPEAGMLALFYLYAADFENPEEVLREHGIA